MPKALVTGGSGFIGSHTILQRLAAGCEVRTTVRNLGREGEVRALLKEGGAEPGPRLTFAAAGVDYVQHIASPFPAGVQASRVRPDDGALPLAAQ